VDRTFDTKKYSSVCVSNFQPIYRSVCRLAGKGDRHIGIIGGLPRLSTTKERISAYQQAIADCGLTEDNALIRYGGSGENNACNCLDELLAQGCDAVIVTNGLMASDIIIYLLKKDVKLLNKLDLVSFVDYSSNFTQLYEGQVDSIIQPVEELGASAGELILKRVEEPETPVFEKVLTSAYKPHDGQPTNWAHSDR
jgi:LacI family transcriptional regulator